MKISLDAGIAGNDWDQLFKLCDGLGVHDVTVPLHGMYEAGKGVVSEGLLRSCVRRLEEGGLKGSVAMGFPGLTAEAFLGEEPEKVADLCENLRILADVGIRTAAVFPWVEASGDPREDESRWARFFQVYEQVVLAAEQVGMRIATHGHRIPGILLNNCQSYKKLFDAVPSPANGLTFCMGCLHYTGDDLARCVEQLADRIYLVHVRDLRTQSHSEKIVEAPLGEGEVDIAGALKALQRVGYDGLLAVEHIPSIPWRGDEKVLAQVQAIGFIKALLAAG